MLAGIDAGYFVRLVVKIPVPVVQVLAAVSGIVTVTIGLLRYTVSGGFM